PEALTPCRYVLTTPCAPPAIERAAMLPVRPAAAIMVRAPPASVVAALTPDRDAAAAIRALPAAAAPDATANPPAPSNVPAAAPAPSCGAPETRPDAMPGPKIPSPSIDNEASMIASALSMVMSPADGAVNSAKIPDPMPTMTASTRTLIPDETTLPST